MDDDWEDDVCDCDICSSGFDCDGGRLSLEELNEWYERDIQEL